MTPFSLVLVFVVALGLRLGFLAIQLRDPDALWSDYERRGAKYRVAQGIDALTVGVFTILVLMSLYDSQSLRYPLGTTFVGFLGVQLLMRFRVHRFPRTNVPGAVTEAKIDLLVHLLMSLAGAVAITLAAAVFLWWRG